MTPPLPGLELALAVPLYWLVPARARPVFLAVASLAVLLPHDPAGVLALAGWSLVFWSLAPLGRRHGAVTAALVLSMLAYLAWFKYVPPLRASLAGEPAPPLALPLGISYLAFRLIHYAVETGRGRLTERSIGAFLSWALFFPVFTAGPIERFGHFLAGRADRFSRADLVQGLTRIVHGLIKKFALAGSLAPWLEHPGVDAGPAALWLFCAVSFVHVYLDFSAYSDLAIGAGRLFGHRIEENFRWPLLASDIGDFWGRWHCTLVSWCRDYVYFPLIARTRDARVSVYALWLAIALWHAATPGWIAWGLWHATGVVLHRTWRRFRDARGWTPLRRGGRAGLRRVAGAVLTFLFVAASFAFTASDGRGGLREALAMLRAMLFLGGSESG